ncbi:hypothetical protein GQ53DRAFT_548805 [Thozetella sp. PMI_491]|nr:hypothetical protein GQ53DRAFT_548805 [Thozetella sp. PMI_491]
MLRMQRRGSGSKQHGPPPLATYWASRRLVARHVTNTRSQAVSSLPDPLASGTEWKIPPPVRWKVGPNKLDTATRVTNLAPSLVHQLAYPPQSSLSIFGSPPPPARSAQQLLFRRPYVLEPSVVFSRVSNPSASLEADDDACMRIRRRQAQCLRRSLSHSAPILAIKPDSCRALPNVDGTGRPGCVSHP